MAKDVRYQTVAQEILKHIQSGKYPVGCRLPTEDELKDIYEVSRHTIREALRTLRMKGVLMSRQGSGTLVSAKELPSQTLYTEGNQEEILYFQKQTHLSIIEKKIKPMDCALRKAVGLNVKHPWKYAQAVRYKDKSLTATPLMLSEFYLLPEFKKIDMDLTKKHQLIDTLKKTYHVVVAFIEQELEVVHLEPSRAALLKVQKNTMGLRAIRKYFTPENQVFLVNIDFTAPGMHVYRTKWKVTNQS